MDGVDHYSARARIAWLSPEERMPADAAAQFEKAGYTLVEAGSFPAPDLAVVDLRQHKLTAKAAQKLAAVTRSAAPDCGLIYVGPYSLAASERAHLRRSGDLVLAEFDVAAVIEACRQRLRLRNIAEETGERLKSIAASTRLSDFPPIETSNAAPSVIIAGAPGPSALAALAAAETVSERTIGALSAAQAMRALEVGAFDCAVILPNSAGDPLLGLARAMRRHRQFQDLPVILIGDGRARPGGNIAELMPDAHIADDLGARILAVSRRARLAAAMRRFLSACAGDGVRDPLSGAFAPPFFSQHAERLFARADATRRPLTLIGLRLAAAGPDDAEPAAARTLADAARLVHRVTRAEDFLARLSSDTFVALLSATAARDGAVAAKRIEGVIANTMFRESSGGRPFAVAAATAIVEKPPRARLDETVATVLSRLKAATPKTAER